jgi:hypothetical protein
MLLGSPLAALSQLEPHNRRAPTPALGRGFAKTRNPWVSRQNTANGFFLNALSSPVDEAYFLKTGLDGCLQVRLDDGRDVPRGEAMEVEAILHRHTHRVGNELVRIGSHRIV